MGIPHLITYLRPFATSVDLAGHSAVIDGPGLAYHVWYICISSKGEARNPFEATPSYRLLGETAIRWLDELQAHDVTLKKIFFDGFLPASKRNTRIGRIAGYTKQLHDYNQAWPQMIPSSYLDTSSESPDVKLFNTSFPAPSFTRLPAAPFLVPAIIEALSQCERYANLIEVVPGEADSYCADYVKTHGVIVFTGDSDLLVHDLGDGAVCFFKDIDLGASKIGAPLLCIRYQVGAIVQRLGLEQTHGLLALAFEMTMDAHGSFRGLLQKAVKLSAIKMHGPMYQGFASEYKAPQGGVKLQDSCKTGNVIHSPSLSDQLKRIDPRVSEYLLQFSKFSQAAGLPASLQSRSIGCQSNIDVFLPFLLDCPLRTSAWEMSTSVRQLAYGLVNLVLPEEEIVLNVTEYRRLQNGSRGRQWQVPAAQDLPKACADLHELVEKICIGMSLQSKQHMWRALAIYQDQELHLGTVKPGLSSALIELSKYGKTSPSRLTWDAIHLSAQFQGSYYSFRILKQILSVILLCVENKPVPLALRQLQITLRSLPTIDELPPVVEAIRIIGDSDDQIILKMVHGHLGIRPMGETIKVQKNRKRKKRKTDDASETSKDAEVANRQAEQRSQGNPSDTGELDYDRKETNNIFELLSSG